MNHLHLAISESLSFIDGGILWKASFKSSSFIPGGIWGIWPFKLLSMFKLGILGMAERQRKRILESLF